MRSTGAHLAWPCTATKTHPNAVPVVLDLQQLEPALLHSHHDGPRARVQAVLHQLLSSSPPYVHTPRNSERHVRRGGAEAEAEAEGVDPRGSHATSTTEPRGRDAP